MNTVTLLWKRRFSVRVHAPSVPSMGLWAVQYGITVGIVTVDDDLSIAYVSQIWNDDHTIVLRCIIMTVSDWMATM